MGGRWDRDLDADLAEVHAWRPDLAISLLEDHEFATLEIAEFRETVAALPFPWTIVPIRDGGVPGRAFDVVWETLGPRARNVLRCGGRVLVHCRAGLGRTGTIAARLLVELGADPDDAIRRVRAARRHTIENHEQEDHVRACRAIPAKTTRTEAIRGMMYGGAIGDALGSAFEFMLYDDIAQALGQTFAWQYVPALPRSLLYPREPGRATDDTALALSVAYVVAAGGELDAADFGNAFTTDLARGARFSPMFWNGGPGGATTQALRRLERGAAAADCGDASAGGNGAAMRAHPIGMLRDRRDVLRVANLQARVTHGHPAAVAGAQAVAVTVFDALAGCEVTIAPPSGITEPQFLRAWWDAHRDFGESAELPKHLRDAEMSGRVTAAVAHAIAFKFRNDPARAVAAAAASGRDTDTVASIVGAIVGARYGVGIFPPEWVTDLADRKTVEAAVAALLVTDKERSS